MDTAPIHIPYSANLPGVGGGGVMRIGNPIVAVGSRPVELFTTGYQTFDVSPAV